MKTIPYLMHEDALKLKATAEALLEFKESATIAVDCAAFLSLIEQAHSPQLGLATTKEIRAELIARGPDSPDDYKTFDPARELRSQVADALMEQFDQTVAALKR